MRAYLALPDNYFIANVHPPKTSFQQTVCPRSGKVTVLHTGTYKICSINWTNIANKSSANLCNFPSP